MAKNPARKTFGASFVKKHPERFNLKPGTGSSPGADKKPEPSPKTSISSSSSGSQRSEPIIPDFVRDIIEDRSKRMRIGNRALEDLRKAIRGPLVAPLSADQLESLERARGVARGPDLRQAIDVVRGASRTGEGTEFLRALTRGEAPAPDTSSESFQNAFESAVRRAQPGIFSTFAAAGRTGSGLAQTAQTQAQADAFAGLFNQARNRQLQSAQLLANRQFQAAQSLPSFLLQPSRILGNVGDVLQQQRQREITAPIQAKQAFASTAAGSAVPVPISPLIGQTSTTSNFATEDLRPTALIQNLTAAGIDPQSDEGKDIILNALQGQQPQTQSDLSQGIMGGLGGAGTGAAIGSVVPGIGTTIGAIGGGLIGGLGGLL